MADIWAPYRYNSKGWMLEPPVKLHVCVMFGAGYMLSPTFVKEQNITHVINCAFENDSPDWFKTHNPSRYACIYAVDSKHVNITDWYPMFEEVMDKFLHDSTSKVIFVHCQCGINRSGFLTLSYCIKRFGYDYRTTVSAILAQRPCALTNMVFLEQILNYNNK